MTSFYEKNKYLIYGVSAVAVGAGIYYLMTRDGERVIRYNPKVHTLEKLHRLNDDIFLESAT